jgi:hypothetical protein
MLHADGYTDGRTDGQPGTKKLIVAFVNFANVPKNATLCPHNLFTCLKCVSQPRRNVFTVRHELHLVHD